MSTDAIEVRELYAEPFIVPVKIRFDRAFDRACSVWHFGDPDFPDWTLSVQSGTAVETGFYNFSEKAHRPSSNHFGGKKHG
jgi:hypothetical protein